ncbi:ABC transporter, permease protein [Streptococcus sp. DD10]|nr:ABC transporter, permease protein [Streptococcus sp. DD10]
MTDIETLTKKIEHNNQAFYRSEFTDPQTGNDTMKYNINGVSQFSSVRNTLTSSTLDKLGFYSPGTNLNLRYQNNSIIMDVIFTIKYNLSEFEIDKKGFTRVTTSNKVNLFENSNALGLAILTSTPYEDVKFDHLTLDNQTKFLNQLSNQQLTYYYHLNAFSDDSVTTMGNRQTIKQDASTKMTKASYTVEVPADQQVYLTLANLNFTNQNYKELDITVQGKSYHYKTNNVFPFFNIGYFSTAQTITIEINFPENSEVSYNTPEFYGLNLDNFQTAIATLQNKNVETKVNGNFVTTNYNTEKDASLFYTIPYDKGWTATVNGRSVPIRQAQTGFMAVDVKAGSGQVQLRFVPNGLFNGTILSLIGSFSFIIYHFFTNRKQK